MNRGVSTMVISLIVLLLSIGTIAVISIAINNVIKKGSENLDVTQKCLGVNVAATYARCNPDKTNPESCTIQLQRTGQNDDPIGGVKVVFINSSGVRSSSVTDFSGNIDVLGGRTETITEGLLPNVNKVEATVYFNDQSGNPQFCPQSSSFDF